ncbi:hypothetical protein PVAG01_08238 [Phlyctema vagabunda]|uniref:Uncharacterized protein n=1 Tax=Phlyctema vagabunda TaxID=108571 RepID=A0ABR4P8U7_9HELO
MVFCLVPGRRSAIEIRIRRAITRQPSSLQLNVISTAVVLSQAIVSTADLGTASLSAQATDSLSSTLTSSSMVSTTTATSQVSRPSETASQTSVSSTTISPSSADATAIVPASVRNNRTRDSRLAPIVGGTLGGVLILGSVLVSLFFCRRRNQKREAEKFHTGAFITQRGSDGEPFQQHEHAPFSPDDYGHRSLESVNTETPMTQQYAQTLSQHPPHPAVFPIVYRNARRDTQTPPPPEYAPPRANAHESTPLVSGMDESSHSWPQHAQPSIPRKPHPSDDVPPAMAEEPVQTWDVVNLRGGSGDRDHSRPPSPLRHISLSRIVRSPTADIAVREDGWRPEPLSPVSALTPPPKNPRRLELAASRSQSELKRYQLVDRPPRGDHVPVLHRRGDNVPILQSPGALRRQRRL